MEHVHPLKSFRDKTQRTQDDLADYLGVSRTTVARWETGARKIDAALLDAVSTKTDIPKRDLRPDLQMLMGEAAE